MSQRRANSLRNSPRQVRRPQVLTDPDALLDALANTTASLARREGAVGAARSTRDRTRVRAAVEVVLAAGDASDPEGYRLLATVLKDLVNTDRAKVSEDEVVKEWVLSHRTELGTYQVRQLSHKQMLQSQ